MNDLRHDQEAADAATHTRLRNGAGKPKPAEAFAELRREFGDVFDAMPDPAEATCYDLPTVTCPAQVLTPDELRTVPMPELRSPAARELDAETRDLRTADQRHSDEIAAIHADLELLWGAVTALLVEREKGRVHD